MGKKKPKKLIERGKPEKGGRRLLKKEEKKGGGQKIFILVEAFGLPRITLVGKE